MKKIKIMNFIFRQNFYKTFDIQYQTKTITAPLLNQLLSSQKK